MKKEDIERLIALDIRIQEIATEFGLSHFQQEFDIIPAQKMLEILSYRFPINFSHWSFGRDYEMERTRYEHGMGIPLEVVLNSDPSRAYLMNTNSVAVQALVIAHVYAHNSFMKNNKYFGPTRRDILPSASEASLRFQNYEKRYELKNVEALMDAGLAIEANVDPDFFIKEESEDDQMDRLIEFNDHNNRGQFDDLIGNRNSGLQKKVDRDKLLSNMRKKTPLEPERDILKYIINHSPKPLQEWEKDILSVLRDQSRYFMPQRRTKFMNEGFASYWHSRIMDKLLAEGLLTNSEHGQYNLCNARVLASSASQMNPYLVGKKMFEDIEDRWNKGQFGKEWDECPDPNKYETWDKKLGKGREKLFEVASTYSDRFFMEDFLTEQLVDDLNLYIFEGQIKPGELQYVITDTSWKKIRQLLVSYLSTFGIPLIYVEDGDFRGKRELYLRHAYEGIELDEDYRTKTIEHIHYLWDRPVHLETMKGKEKVIYTYNGSNHTEDNSYLS
jgi:stage V sporulation protein R